MKAVCIAFFSFFLLPSLALSAGFAKQSIFLSKTNPVAGEALLVHVIVSNDSNTKFSGVLLLREQNTDIGSVALELEAQGAQVATISWKPAAGFHAITAQLAETNGTPIAQETASFTVEQKQSDTENVSGDVQSSKDIQEQIQQLSPSIAKAATPIFSTVDSIRGTAATTLQKGAQWAKEKSDSSTGTVLGASTEIKNQTAAAAFAAPMHIGAGVLERIFLVMLSFVKNAALFYPVLAFGFLYFLWRMYKRMRGGRFR